MPAYVIVKLAFANASMGLEVLLVSVCCVLERSWNAADTASAKTSIKLQIKTFRHPTSSGTVESIEAVSAIRASTEVTAP